MTINVEPPIKEDYVQWRANPVTKFYLQALFNTREGKKETIAEGGVTGEELEREIGRTQGIKDAIDYALFSFEVIEVDNSETK